MSQVNEDLKTRAARIWAVRRRRRGRRRHILEAESTNSMLRDRSEGIEGESGGEW